MSYLFAILLFSFLIFIHELGHFTAAKLFGVQGFLRRMAKLASDFGSFSDDG